MVVMVAMDMDANVEMLMRNQKLKLMLITAMGDMEDMDIDVNAAMLMLNQKLTLITDMVVTADMDTAASADLLLLKPLQLHIMAMEDTADTVGMDMDAKDDLLGPIMDMEATEDMDTDMDVKVLLVNSEENQLNPTTKDQSNEEFSSTPNNPFISKK